LHNEELHGVCTSPDVIRVIKSRHVTYIGKKRNICMVLVGKYEGKRSLGRPVYSWEVL
jgi:hypothetical protein